MKKDIPVEIYLPKSSSNRDSQDSAENAPKGPTSNLGAGQSPVEEQSNMPVSEDYLKLIKDELEQIIIKDPGKDEK